MKKILIAPLDWGLGHATRCIPIIEALLKRGCTVLVAGSGESLQLLRHEFPSLTFFALPPYAPKYSYDDSMVLSMARQIPKFVSVIRKEHLLIESLVERHNIDLVISDNRYGCWSSMVTSVFITHQLNILMPRRLGWIEPVVRNLNQNLIRKFSQCWIPDYSENDLRLSGRLSESDKISLDRITFVGPLSRFQPTVNADNEYDLICVLSGPEPQRSIFEEKVCSQLRISGLRYLVVRGILQSAAATRENEIGFLSTEDLQRVISKSSVVIARSGYSTIMDLVVLGKKGILVPTPGQTEQEYLADRWKRNGVFYSVPQHEFDLKNVLEMSKSYRVFQIDRARSAKLLEGALDQLLVGKKSMASVP
ncbi:MAG TPA: glycosyltransferase [Chryseolinea sp.]